MDYYRNWINIMGAAVQLLMSLPAAVTVLGTWTAKTGLSSARGFCAGAGTSTAALVFGGVQGGSATRLNSTEVWNNTSWSAGGNLTAGKSAMGSAGTTSDAICVTGTTTTGINVTEKYNGSSWSTSGTFAQTQFHNSVVGSGSAALSMGAWNNSFTPQTFCAVFNGSTWSNAAANLPVGKAAGVAAGTTTAALYMSGTGAATDGATYSFNGSTWSTVTTQTILVYFNAGGGASNTAALVFGGRVSGNPSTSTQSYNSTTWSTRGSLNTAREGLGGAVGTNTAALSMGGNTTTSNTSYVNTVEQYAE